MHFASVKPSAERLYTFLNMEEERSGSKRVEKEISPILEFKNVRFQYTKDREVLKKVSFKLEPGEKVAIIGKKWKWKINNNQDAFRCTYPYVRKNHCRWDRTDQEADPE